VVPILSEYTAQCSVFLPVFDLAVLERAGSQNTTLIVKPNSDRHAKTILDLISDEFAALTNFS
jgi:hypothetical protein